MNVFSKFDEIPSMILQDIKETKCYGHKNVSDTRSDNVKTVYPPTNTVCEGYNDSTGRDFGITPLLLGNLQPARGIGVPLYQKKRFIRCVFDDI